jgi:hypothetical protein
MPEEHMPDHVPMSESKLLQALDYAYDKAVNGVVGLDSAVEMAEGYLRRPGSVNEQVSALIRWQKVKAGTSGFLTGSSGIILMPVTIPANVASVLYVQIRMIAAVAHMGGHDLHDDRVRTLCYVCMAGNSAKDILKDTGIIITTKLANSAINKISGTTITAINQRVGFRLLTKFGQTGAVNLGKVVPVLGGLLGGSFDWLATSAIGVAARRTFIQPAQGENA